MIAQDQYALAWYWKAQIISYVYKLNNRTKNFIRNAIVESEIPLELYRPNGFDIAIHVRRGDKISECEPVPNEEYKAVLMIAKEILGREPTVFLATHDEETIDYFKKVQGIKLYYLKDKNRITVDDPRSRSAKDIMTLYSIADIELMCQANIVIGCLCSNFMRLVMELRAAQLGLASNLYMECGPTGCVSMTQCNSRKIPWMFDWDLKQNRSWEFFIRYSFGKELTGASLERAWQAKMNGPDPIPRSLGGGERRRRK
jgi:hypothetical protein